MVPSRPALYCTLVSVQCTNHIVITYCPLPLLLPVPPPLLLLPLPLLLLLLQCMALEVVCCCTHRYCCSAAEWLRVSGGAALGPHAPQQYTCSPRLNNRTLSSRTCELHLLSVLIFTFHFQPNVKNLHICKPKSAIFAPPIVNIHMSSYEDM